MHHLSTLGPWGPESEPACPSEDLTFAWDLGFIRLSCKLTWNCLYRPAALRDPDKNPWPFSCSPLLRRTAVDLNIFVNLRIPVCRGRTSSLTDSGARWRQPERQQRFKGLGFGDYGRYGSRFQESTWKLFLPLMRGFW